jgi:hypothetical protein
MQTGGGEKIIPMYRAPDTNALPNEQKQIFQQKMAEKGEKPPIQPTINFQYYTPPKPRSGPPSGVNPAMYAPIYPQGLAYPPQFNYPYGEQSFHLPPIIKNIQINTEGPSGHHERLFIINEDVMPIKSIGLSLTTIGERLTAYQFIRSSIFNNTDGLDIGLDGKSPNSLLSFIKFGELNPYNSNKLSNNPYKGLPDNFLIYSSCYPIRHQESFGGVICAKDSTSVTIRIYKLSEGSFLINRLNPSLYFKCDEWREVAFYEFIREYIIKRKVCPHFPTLYGYFIADKTGIDFAKIAMIKNSMTQQISNEPQYNIRPEETNECITREDIRDGKIVSITDTKIQYLNKNNKILEINPNAYLGKSLILLTESPTYNILGWASKTYQQKGNVKEMINRGVHTEKEWLNVLFQIMISLISTPIGYS